LFKSYEQKSGRGHNAPFFFNWNILRAYFKIIRIFLSRPIKNRRLNSSIFKINLKHIKKILFQSNSSIIRLKIRLSIHKNNFFFNQIRLIDDFYSKEFVQNRLNRRLYFGDSP